VSDLITICIPTYRRPSLLLSCLQTCFLQEYRPLEIDVGDNSPDDQTERLLRAIAPPPGITLRYWRNDPPLGPVGNVQKLFAEARGRRLLLMHDDDALLPGAMAALDAAFRMAPDVVLAYGSPEVINERGERVSEETERDNLNANRTPEQAGLRRDLLSCAFWRQVPPNGFLIDAEAARRVGFRERTEVGLAVDTDFGVRLARAYRGTGAFVYIDQPTSQYRLAPTSQRFNEPDTCWKFYDDVARIGSLTPEEEQARDVMLAQIARAAVIENALGGRRRAALRIFLSRHYPRPEGWARTLYVLGLLAMPRTFRAVRRYLGVMRPDFVAPPPLPAAPRVHARLH
jgi:glycosyltransferase involved in cell wall biosynthesis